MPVPRAQLRVYSPLESFPRVERERWRTYVAEGGGLSAAQVSAVEYGAVVAGLLGDRPVPDPQVALVRRSGSRMLVCPLELGLRAEIAFGAFRDQVPPAALAAFDPGNRWATARAVPAGRLPHVRDAAWAVPLVWFVAFSPADRRSSDPLGTGPQNVHLTFVEQALERLEDAAEIVEATVADDGAALGALVELADWLDGFDPAGLLELDFGGVGWQLAPDRRRAEHTCADLWGALDALRAGDLAAAAEAYAAAHARWARYVARQDAS